MKLFAPLLLAMGAQAGVGSRVVEMVKGNLSSKILNLSKHI